MIKVTRLNNQVIALNPDLVLWAEASPDTTLFMVGGEKLIVRESLDELMSRVMRYQRSLRTGTRRLVERPAHLTVLDGG